MNQKAEKYLLFSLHTFKMRNMYTPEVTPRSFGAAFLGRRVAVRYPKCRGGSTLLLSVAADFLNFGVPVGTGKE